MSFQIQNDGTEIQSTDYWETPQAEEGYLYGSFSNGTLRLLVPDPVVQWIDDMQTGHHVLMTPSVREPRSWDILFDNGHESPFIAIIDERQLDGVPTSGRYLLTVWTRGGQKLRFNCTIRTEEAVREYEASEETRSL